jgi:hypothetical protein
VELEQARTLGTHLRERAIHPLTAATGWFAGTDRAAERIGFIVAGDLPRCARLVDGEAVELAWSSITEDILAIRGRVEGW